jgi:hypothetical protein
MRMRMQSWAIRCEYPHKTERSWTFKSFIIFTLTLGPIFPPPSLGTLPQCLPQYCFNYCHSDFFALYCLCCVGCFYYAIFCKVIEDELDEKIGFRRLLEAQWLCLLACCRAVPVLGLSHSTIPPPLHHSAQPRFTITLSLIAPIFPHILAKPSQTYDTSNEPTTYSFSPN